VRTDCNSNHPGMIFERLVTVVIYSTGFRN